MTKLLIGLVLAFGSTGCELVSLAFACPVLSSSTPSAQPDKSPEHGSRPQDQSDCLIGLLLPPEEPAAASLEQGVRLGIELAAQGSSAKVRVIIRGRVGQWGADAVEAARMVLDDSVQGLIAPPDGAASHVALQVSGRTAVPVVSLCADSSITQTGVPWMVRLAPATVDQATTVFTGVAAALPGRPNKWLAVVPDGRAGREIAADLKCAAANAHCSVTDLQLNATLTNAVKQYHPILDRILEKRPGAVLLWLPPAQAGRLAKLLRTSGFTGTLAGPWPLRSAEFAAAAGVAIEGFCLPVPVLNKADEVVFEQFASAFQRRYGWAPDAMATLSYDAARLLVHILREADGRPPRAVFPPGFSLPGASGPLCFDNDGNRKVSLQLLEGRDGHFIPIPEKQSSKNQAP